MMPAQNLMIMQPPTAYVNNMMFIQNNSAAAAAAAAMNNRGNLDRSGMIWQNNIHQQDAAGQQIGNCDDTISI